MFSYLTSFESSSRPCRFVGALMRKEDHHDKFFQGGYLEHGFKISIYILSDRCESVNVFQLKLLIPGCKILVVNFVQIQPLLWLKAIGIIKKNSANGIIVEVR